MEIFLVRRSRETYYSNSHFLLLHMNIIITYGTETGNSEYLANDAGSKLSALGHQTEVQNMDDVSVDQIKASDVALIVTSTWGDGEPPSNAANLYASLEASSEDLSSVRFAVFALGDENFDQFCKAGKDFDAFLERLGAQRLLPVTTSNGDHDDTFPGWVDSVAEKL